MLVVEPHFVEKTEAHLVDKVLEDRAKKIREIINERLDKYNNELNSFIIDLTTSNLPVRHANQYLLKYQIQLQQYDMPNSTY
jgi:hypothetical protein